MSNKLMVKVALMWRSAEQGGRKRPISTADYAATAYFVDGERQLFSVILHFPSTLQNGIKTPFEAPINPQKKNTVTKGINCAQLVCLFSVFIIVVIKLIVFSLVNC